MRVLVDTCVIIDALQSRVPFAEVAQKIFIHSANKQFEGYITAKSVTDIYYLTHRLTHSDAETRKILSKLFTLFHLLDTTSLDCRKAISSEISDYEDAIMVETAIRSEMDCRRCPKTMSVLFTLCEIIRCGGSFKARGSDKDHEIDFGCADNCIQFHLEAKKLR